MIRLIGVSCLLLVSACAVWPQRVTRCADVRSWSLSEQAELRREYDALKPDALLRAAFKDYLVMRDEAHACAATDS